MRKDPGDKYSWYNLGTIAAFTCDAPTAETDYLKAIDLDPSFEPALYNLGVLRYNASDWDGAISYLERAVAVNDKDARAHWMLGLALAHEHGDRRGSTRQLNEAVRLDPGLPHDDPNPPRCRRGS